MIKVPISQQGAAVTYIASNGALYHDGQTHILVYVHQRVEQPGLPPVVQPLPPMRVDDSTPVPCVYPDNSPVMHSIQRPSGQYEQGSVVHVNPDTGEQTVSHYTDYARPILEDVQVQRTIGEYSAVKWWHWDRRNPVPQPSIEEMIEEGILRRIGQSANPYHFVVTDEFTQAFGDNW